MSDLFLRFPRLPHLPEYKTPQNQVDEAAAIKKYREDLHRALQEGIATTDADIGPASPTTASITATTPIVVTPSPLTGIGVISHANTAVTPNTYGDGTHVPQITVDQKGHVTGVSNVAITGGGSSSPLTTKGDVWGYDSANNRIPIGADNYVLTADSAQALGLKWAPVPTSGTLQSQEFTSSGTWTCPSGVTSVWITMIGGGGGGSTSILAATGGGGGGSGELTQNLPVIVSGNVSITIGAKGTGGAASQASAQVGVAGGDTSFGSQFIARGGKGGATSGASGAGGGVGGNASKGAGGAAGALGAQEAPTYFGGNSGGSGATTTSGNGGPGSGAPGYPTGASQGGANASQAGGGGGANTIYGAGGAGGTGGSIGISAASTSYGAGGGGGGGHATTTVGGGDGCAGYCLVQWVA